MLQYPYLFVRTGIAFCHSNSFTKGDFSMRTGKRASLYAPAVYGPAGRILCTIYTAEGDGPHPVLIFTHGYPGHEKNLDLAQTLRRAGFSSVIFFYRGCWGSDGDFSFEGSFEDTRAVLDFILNDTKYNFDKDHIFFIGHSLGCVNAARMIAACPQVKGGVFLAPCDLWRLSQLGLEEPDYHQHLQDVLEEGISYIRGTDIRTLTREIQESDGRLSIDSCIPSIAGKPLLWVSSPDDDVVSEEKETWPYIRKMKACGASGFKWLRVSSDHYFSNMRSQLTEDITSFLLEHTETKKARIDHASFEMQLRRLIRQQPGTITLSFVAGYFHITAPYASSLIHQVSGKSFSDLVLEERMAGSAKLLRESSLPISKVALLSGYQEPSYFMKVFKKYYGCTPSAYRKQQ